jgi:hypothetical protein
MGGGGKGWGLAPTHGFNRGRNAHTPEGAGTMHESNGIGPSPWTPCQHVTTSVLWGLSLRARVCC